MEAKNWKEYIQEKFGDESKFRILNLQEDFVEIRSADSSIPTVIEFIFADNLKDLEGVSFWGDDDKICGYWSAYFSPQGEFMFKPEQQNYLPSPGLTPVLENFPYTAELIDILEKQWLFIPLYKGWTEHNVLVGQTLHQSQLLTTTEKGENLNIVQKKDIGFGAKLKKLFSGGLNEESHHFKPLN